MLTTHPQYVAEKLETGIVTSYDSMCVMAKEFFSQLFRKYVRLPLSVATPVFLFGAFAAGLRIVTVRN